MNTPEGILCSVTHEWVLENSDEALVGITDWQANQLGDIVSVELPETGLTLSKNEPFATIESVRNAYELYMPVGGEIIEVNEQLINSPDLINENSYENYFIKIKPSNFQEDSEGLMEYSDYIDEVI